MPRSSIVSIGRSFWCGLGLLALCFLGLHCDPKGPTEPPVSEGINEVPNQEPGSQEPISTEGRGDASQEPPITREAAPEPRPEPVPEPPTPDASEPSPDVIPEGPNEAPPKEPPGPDGPDGAAACKQDADCPQGSCAGTKPCSQIAYQCQKGRCVQVQSSLSDGACEPKRGVCVPSNCLSHCDCPQGYDCLSGLCKYGIKAKYCCENDLCPLSQPCSTRLQTASFCKTKGTGEKECKDYGGYCTANTLSCQAGHTAYSQVPCPSKGDHCCLPPLTNTQCKGKSGRCIPQGSSCKVDEQIAKLSCGASQETCCIPKPPPPNDCVSQGGVCYNLATACKSGYNEHATVSCGSSQLKCCIPASPQCQQDSDCGSPRCQETAKGCAEAIPTCQQGSCQAMYKTAPGKCDAAKGRCL